VTGDVTAARERQATDGIAPVRAVGHLMAALNSYTSLASLQVLQGRLRTAAATYAEVDRLVPGQDALQSLVGSPSYYFGMGDLLREWNKLDDAERYLLRGMELMQGTLATEGEVIMLGYLALARVQQARGSATAANATLQVFMDVARKRKLFHVLLERSAAMQARLQLMQDDLPAARRWADESGLHPDDEITFRREAAYLTLARVRVAAGQAEDVVPLLDRLLAQAMAQARMHSAIEILLLQALAAKALDDQRGARTALEQALALGEPEGYIRSFADEGAPMAELLGRMQPASSPVAAYVATLLAAFPSAL
jgi:LuxR family maltose regulon positive regulatory protein